MVKFDYDLFVIGGGSGGVRSARLAAGLGVRTAIAEEYRFGGTCVIRGCIPKKLFVYASEFGHAIDDARAYGWSTGEKRFDWQTLVANKDAEIERLSKLYSGAVEKAGGTVFQDRAEVVGPHEVRLIRDGRTLSAERILIATGGHPFHPGDTGPRPCDHLERGVSPGGAAGEDRDRWRGLHRHRIRQHLQGLGIEVELLYRGGEILRGFDHDGSRWRRS